ncbi:internal scaffolding protein [robinz microvirus RP_103]|nr:internal scaffolding protein [robinz microvirus RP_103]
MSKIKFPQALHDFEGYNSSDTVVYNTEPSLTRQEFAEECDINTLMKRYDSHVIGGPGNLSAKEPLYFDFADLPQDLMGYLRFMDDAESSFMSLPAVVRKEFDNSAMEFIGFASDPSNLEQMRSWGLAPPAKPAEAPREDPSSVSPPPEGGPSKAS